MAREWRIGAVAGVPLYLSRGWPIGAALVVALYHSALTRVGVGAGTALSIALVLALALFLSVLLHELAHGLTGTALGRVPTRYTLTLWGGYTRFPAETSTPGVSALVSAAGPLTNLLLAGVLRGVLEVAPVAAEPYLVPLMYVNLALGAFNLLPGLPMDGGRIVEALVWAGTNNCERGTLVASWIGLLGAVGLGVWGFVKLTGENEIFSIHLWAVMIAVMLGDGALHSLRRTRTRMAAGAVDLRELMDAVPVVPPGTPVGQVPPAGAVVVDGQVRGVVTPELRADVTDDAVPVDYALQVVPESAVLRLAQGVDAVGAAAVAARSSDLLVLLVDGGAWIARVSDFSQKLDAVTRRSRTRR